MTPPRLALLCLVPLLTACEQTPPLVTASWANRARMVISPDTPPEAGGDLEASYGPPDDRDQAELTSLSGDRGLVQVEMRLEPGVYLLDDPVALSGVEVVIQGAGSHKTRIDLDCESKTTLLIERAPKVVIKGVTLYGLTGGGIRLRDCPDVVIEDVHVAGARYGFELVSSAASIGTSIFAGCQEALVLDDASVSLRETAFVECWRGITGQGSLDLEACLFADGREGIPARLDRRSRVVSCMFAGERQAAGWDGKPGDASNNLAGLVDLGDRFGPATNRLIRRREEFPYDLPHGLPPDFDLAAVHLTLERVMHRGESDPPKRVRAAAEDHAIEHARRARSALVARRVEDARREARIAIRFLTGRTDLPDEVAAVTDLAVE